MPVVLYPLETSGELFKILELRSFDSYRGRAPASVFVIFRRAVGEGGACKVVSSGPGGREKACCETSKNHFILKDF